MAAAMERPREEDFPRPRGEVREIVEESDLGEIPDERKVKSERS